MHQLSPPEQGNLHTVFDRLKIAIASIEVRRPLPFFGHDFRAGSNMQFSGSINGGSRCNT
ncbi:hypothetical protein WN55_03998 [Dufourea novaeangliae]|uniref:Uncharacterized protein n=1 Tax=Dufourea novaeangliae TaxID=178035 RepID=A0A154PMM4_DUFNO|nr:hypothetical protein WN55_03998 [Dufourea novaeangliae]